MLNSIPVAYLVENNGLGIDLVERGGCGPGVVKSIQGDIRFGDCTVVEKER